MLARSTDFRKSVRRWMHRDAEIAFKSRAEPIHCTIHDMSDGGARISLRHPVTLPPILTLVLFKNSAQRNCKVVWTDGRFVGVKFTSEWFGAKLSERPKVRVEA